jgi:hypothetical protein
MTGSSMIRPAAGLIAGLALLLPSLAAAQIELGLSVNGAGGAIVSNASYIHGCTVGQAVVGTTTSALYIHNIGFWYPTGYFYSDAPEPLSEMPTEFALGFGGSNPSGSLTRIVYAVPVPTQVSIRLFDITGREVWTLVAGQVEPGYHEADLRAPGLTGGIYFCRMDAGGYSATRKLVLLR